MNAMKQRALCKKKNQFAVKCWSADMPGALCKEIRNKNGGVGNKG